MSGRRLRRKALALNCAKRFFAYTDTAFKAVMQAKGVVLSNGKSAKKTVRGLSYASTETFQNNAEIITLYEGKYFDTLWEVGVRNCTNLQYVTMPAKTSSYFSHFIYAPFDGCTSLKTVTFSEGLTTLIDRACRNCTSLQSVVLPTTLTSINNECFKACTSLTSINLPDGITSIGTSAFSKCLNLSLTSLPASLTTIGEGCFAGGNEVMTGISITKIPNGVTFLPKNAFNYCRSLRTIEMPDNLTELEGAGNANGGVFANCQGMTTLVWGANNDSTLKTIGAYAFTYDDTMNFDAFPTGIETIGDGAFRQCLVLTAPATFPKCTSIGNYAFYKTAISGVCSAPELLTIGDRGLAVTPITKFDAPKCTTIGNYCFNGCSSLTEINIPECTEIKWGAFQGSALTGSISLPKVVTIGADVFMNMTTLTGLTNGLPECTSIGDYAFKGSKVAGNIDMPKMVTIGAQAFYARTGITGISIPLCTSVGADAFYNVGITSLSLPKMVSVGNRAFMELFALDGDLSLPECTTVGEYGFANAKKSGASGTLSLPKCTTIGEFAFHECYFSGALTLPECTSIGKTAFKKCQFSSASLPKVTSIPESCFQESPNLTSVVLSGSVTSIGASAFNNCTSLTEITFGGTQSAWSAITFGDDWSSGSAIATIHCTDGDITL